MNTLKCTEVCVNGQEDQRCPGPLCGVNRGHGDPVEPTETRNRPLKKQPPSPEAEKVNHGKFPKQEDSYAFEEDSSSDSLSPEQHHSDESQGSACPSSEAVGSTPSSSSSPALTSPRQVGAVRDPPDQTQDEGLSGTNSCQTTPPIPVPAIVKSKTSDKNRHKKPKDVKPKVKKLKYHQYIPPDQKAEKSPPPMDSAYARLLQQQQLFLQLQILSQQKHAHTHPQTQQNQQHTHTPQAQAQQRQPAFSYQPHPSTQSQKGGAGEQLSACSSSGPSSTVNSNSSSPVKNTYPNQSNISSVKPGPLPANLDDLKVSELRQHLRIRGMPVSGTKTALIERLRPFKDSNAGSSPSGSSDITTVTFPVTPTGSLSSYQSPSSSSALSQGGYYPYPSTSSSPPISPVSSDLSLSGSLPDSFSDVPMSSPTQFNLQPSPAQLSMEDGLGGGGQRSGEGGGMDGLEAEKDKMLVEKQKVIEELTWKLHQEQRQVEELKMQLHKRKRCYGATQDTIPPPSQSHHPSMHQHTPAMMGQHFFGVTIKQEPMSLSSSCPLSSPKQLKSPPGSCMEDLGHCNTQLSNMGAPGGTQCMDAAPSSGSPSTMSAFLSPQCSPQDSPIGKPSSSPQPSSPNNPYLLSPGLGRDGCGHAHQQGNARARTMQMQQKSGGQLVNCSYPSDQRSLQGVFPSSADCGLNHTASAKSENPNMTPKMSVLSSPRHAGLKCQVSTPAFSSSDSAASDLRQPPCYEDAVKQQLSRSQQMDELLDVLIESGEMPANAREDKERSCVTKVVPHITVSPGCPGLLVPRFHRHYEHPSPTQLPYDHSANHIADGHLETLLSSPVGRGGEVAFLKMATEDGNQEDEGNRDGEGYSSPHGHHRHPHPSLQDKLLANRDLMDASLSPVGAKVSAVPEVQGMVSMTFSETPWETMEWLDLTPPSSAMAFSVAPPSGPSIFNTEFLDVTDINLNSAMDLHLEHW
ncbi:myocardin-like isoform X2 [Sphaeramia orbicularis]|uniref:myocardin-like isoform X2 n=1 Tax=Sphaeramia orbicularis TaxID=375764 RepID=UPI00118113E7|nr:myocardin-like isoform X2 [Sphaeramia orbicularis]XP_029977395.1 myocardin-like isoform X2 [Sphaeramia orbicularis]